MDLGDSPIGTDATGVYLSTAPYERIITWLRAAVDAMTEPVAGPPLSAPPVIARATIERAGYVRSFPQLLGTVHSFRGDRREWQPLAKLTADGDWYQAQAISDVVLLPAACYHVYPLWTGTALTTARQCAIHATCFRQEASAEAGRLRSFRMSELVYAGDPADCLRWRDAWRDRLAAWLGELGLSTEVEVADDPFFGPGDRLLKSTQREQQLKWELRVPIADAGPQAIASCNYHLDHFGAAFAFTRDGRPAHSACVAFGLDRIALALISRHGSDQRRWPVAAGGRRAGVPAAG